MANENTSRAPQFTEICELPCKLIRVEGISKATGREYTMYQLEIDTGAFGRQNVVLNTRTDRAGVVISMLDT